MKKGPIKNLKCVLLFGCLTIFASCFPLFSTAACDTSFSTLDTTICGSYVSPSGKYQWDISGTYLDTVTSSKGCDSIITIHVKSLNSHFTVVANACDSFVSYSGNHTWFKSDTYREVFKSASGCDSIVEYQLTINKSHPFQLVYITPWETGPTGKYWAEEGIYEDTILTKHGCDSLFLIIVQDPIGGYNDPIPFKIYDSACVTFISPNGRDTFDSTGVYFLGWGGDTSYRLHLTINKPDTSVTQNGSTLKANMNGASYQWLDCHDGLRPISGATQQSINRNGPGRFAVVINNKGCIDTSACHDVLGTGIYPNPTHGPITIDIGTTQTNMRVHITDVLGHTVSQEGFGNTSIIHTEVAGRKGVYFVELYSNSQQLGVLKVLKE